MDLIPSAKLESYSFLHKPIPIINQWDNILQPQLKRRDEQIALEAKRLNDLEARRKAEEYNKYVITQQQAKTAPVQSPAVSTVINGGTTDAKILALKMCESGNNYAANTGNGYYGAYQYDIGTWNNYGGYHLPSEAPPAVQDAKFAETYARRGASPWPVCGKKAGL